MPRAKSKFTCAKCGQSFKMAMHLGRHMHTRHGQRTAKPAARAVVAGAPKGRPAGIGGRLGLRNMSLDQLIGVITAAKMEASRRIAEIQQTIQ